MTGKRELVKDFLDYQTNRVCEYCKFSEDNGYGRLAEERFTCVKFPDKPHTVSVGGSCRAWREKK